MATRAERQAAAGRRRAQVVQLRLAGASFEEIGGQLGVSDTRAHQLWADALQRTVKEPADQQRMLELQRLDQLQAAATAVLQATHHVIQGAKVVADDQGRPYVDHGPILAAVNTLVRVMERRARLLGLDAPARVDARLDGTLTSVSAVDQELQRLEAELADLDPAYLADKQRGQAAASALAAFRTQWTRPGNPPAGDPAAFVADALEMALAQLRLDPDEEERTVGAVEQLLERVR
jgi:hypothetical protein